MKANRLGIDRGGLAGIDLEGLAGVDIYLEGLYPAVLC